MKKNILIIVVLCVLLVLIGAGTVYYKKTVSLPDDIVPRGLLQTQMDWKTYAEDPLYKKAMAEREENAQLMDKTHEKCPRKMVMDSRAFKGNNIHVYGSKPSGYKNTPFHEIYAYAGISDVYVHILPPVFSYKNVIGREAHKPLSLEKWKELGGKDENYKLLSPESLKPKIKDALNNSIAFCTALKGAQPKQIHWIDKPFHANITKENALTLVIGSEARPNGSVAIIFQYYRPEWNPIIRRNEDFFGMKKIDKPYSYLGFSLMQLEGRISEYMEQHNMIIGNPHFFDVEYAATGRDQFNSGNMVDRFLELILSKKTVTHYEKFRSLVKTN